MIVLVDTSTPTCELVLVQGDATHAVSWDAGRTLAIGLLEFIERTLQEYDATWADIRGIGVFEGPGSFTGLRIGMTVCNTLANTQGVPIVVAGGKLWRQECLDRLSAGEDDKIALPVYGSEANITKPRK